MYNGNNPTALKSQQWLTQTLLELMEEKPYEEISIRDICKKADLIDYSSVKGCMIIRPYGYAIWENIVNILDKKSKYYSS